jgi:thiamine biosynthesis lipoprotein
MTDPRTPEGRHPTRREIVGLGLGAFVVATIPLARRRARLVRRTLPAMGTIVQVAAVHRDTEYAEAAIDAALTRIQIVSAAMTRFDSGSDVGRANLGAAKEGVLVNPATAGVLQTALAWAGASDGAFDPCVGRVIEVWDVEHRHEPPPAGAFARLAGRHFFHDLDLDAWRGHQAVRFTDPDVQIDLGGIAKGYAVDQAVVTLRDWGITQAFVAAGGDLYAMGESDHGGPWDVGIRDPKDPDRVMATFPLSDGAVATSGDYFRYFDYHGRRYHHIMDPVTAAPRLTPEHSVSVAASSCTTADVAATTCFGMTPERAAEVLRTQAADARLVSHV